MTDCEMDKLVLEALEACVPSEVSIDELVQSNTVIRYDDYRIYYIVSNEIIRSILGQPYFRIEWVPSNHTTIHSRSHWSNELEELISSYESMVKL